MNPRLEWVYAWWLTLTFTLSACGGDPKQQRPRWSSGEQLRWARLNPCACLASDQLITSVELRPLDQEDPSRPPPALGPWERVAIKPPLSAESEGLLSALRARQGAPLTLLIEVSSRQYIKLEGHTLRVAQLLARPEPPPEEAEAKEAPAPSGEP